MQALISAEPVNVQIADILKTQGYDYFTALEIAHQTIIEFRACDESSLTYHIGSQAFTLKKGSN
jgi:hypothetical protein